MEIRKVLPSVIFIFAILILWELLCQFFSIASYILPNPISIVKDLFGEFTDLMKHTGITLLEAILGFVIANLIAIILAIIIVYIPYSDKAILPFAIGLKTTPIVALAPLLLIWFGNGITPKVAAAGLICFFPCLVNAIKGLKDLNEGEADLFSVYGATKTKTLFKLRLFRAAPYIFSAFKISSSLAIVGAIIGEFVGANNGIGYLILISSYHLESVRMFSSLITSAIAGIIFYLLITIIENKVVFWLKKTTDENKLESKYVSILTTK